MMPTACTLLSGPLPLNTIAIRPALCLLVTQVISNLENFDDFYQKAIVLNDCTVAFQEGLQRLDQFFNRCGPNMVSVERQKLF